MPINALLAGGVAPLDPAGAYRNALATRGAEAQLGYAKEDRARKNVLAGREDAAYGLQTEEAGQKAAGIEAFRVGLELSGVPPDQLPTAYAQAVAQAKAGRHGKYMTNMPDQFDPQKWQTFVSQTGIANLSPEQRTQVLTKLQSGIDLPKAREPTADMQNYAAEKADPGFAARRNELKNTSNQFKFDHGMGGGSGNAPPVTPVTIRDPNDQNATVIVDGRTGQKIGDGPKMAQSAGGYTPKDISTARSKVLAIKVAQQQLDALKAKRDALLGVADAQGKRSGAYSAGPLQGYVPTQEGKGFDGAIDQLRSSITGLKRVPGVGSMSDYETRLDQSMLPNRNEYEDVIDQKIEGMQSFLTQLNQGYGEIVGQEGLADAGQSPPAQPPANAAPASSQKVRKYNPASRKIE